MGRFFRRKKDAEATTETAEEQPSELQPQEEKPAPAPAADDDGEAAHSVEQAAERTRKGFFGRIGGLFKRGGLDEALWEELEETLVRADAGVQTTIRIINGVRERVKAEKIDDPDAALAILKEEMVKVLDVDTGRGRIWHSTGQHETLPKPAVILVVGVNGTGKTTSIAKLAHAYRDRGLKVVLAAGDTFRAAAIEQLKHWGAGAGVDVVAHQQGADPGAVVFDAMAAAERRDADMLHHRHRRPPAHQGQPDGGAAQGQPHYPAQGPRRPRTRCCWCSTPPPARTPCSRPRTSRRPSASAASCCPSWTARPKAASSSAVCDELGVPVRFVGTGERPQDLALFQPREFVEALFG